MTDQTPDGGRRESKPVYDFAQACRAFDLFTLQERQEALEEMARLRFPSITDRFFEGVHRVIVRAETR